MATQPTNFDKKALRDFYFKPVEGNSDLWECKKCHSSKKQEVGRGYENLKCHAKVCFGEDYLDVFLKSSADASGGTSRLDSFFCLANNRERDLYKWIEWVVMRNQPLSEVDNQLTREGMQWSPVCAKSLRKYILQLSDEVCAILARKLPDSIALLFDGWSDGLYHYVGVCAAYHENGKYNEDLLAIQPLLDDTNLSADEHGEYLQSTVALYKKSIDNNVKCFVGDNCEVNKKMASDMGKPLVGCYSHRFNLGVNRWVKEQPGLEDAIHSIKNVMKKARNLKNAAKLRELTELKALKDNDTRWTSTFYMIKRFFRLQEDFKNIETLENEMPSIAATNVVNRAYTHLKKFHSITVSLQEKGLTLAEGRDIFNCVLEDYPDLSHYLTDDADIVHCVDFERGVCKLAIGADSTLLTYAERQAVAHLKKAPVNEGVEQEAQTMEDNEDITYFEELRRRKKSRCEQPQEYIDVRIIQSTSCSIERLFSDSKHILTDQRKNMSPILFEAILYLKKNRSLWNAETVAKALKRKTDQIRNFELDDDMYYEVEE